MTPLDAGAAHALEALAQMAQVRLADLDPDTARGAFAALLGSMQGEPVDVQVESLLADHVTGRPAMRIYRPRDADPTAAALPAILYFHGGGFMVGNLDLYDVLCSRLSAACGAMVMSVDYRLAPEHPYPAALDDAMAATSWLFEQAGQLGIDPSRCCIAGDSAGGNLAAVTCLRLREAGRETFARQVLLYPVMSLDFSTQAYSRCREGYFLSEEMMRYFADQYLGAEVDRGHWTISPMHVASVEGVPPATILLCGYDPTFDEGLGYAERLAAAGVPASLLTYEAQIHAFVLMDSVVPEALDAIEALASDIKQALSPNQG